MWTGARHETHFWNELDVDGHTVAIDLTWQQFPPGCVMTAREVLDRDRLGDGPPTVARCALLLDAVRSRLCPA